MLGFSAHIPMMELLAFAKKKKNMAFCCYVTNLYKKMHLFLQLIESKCMITEVNDKQYSGLDMLKEWT
jgi:hypothetical protein